PFTSNTSTLSLHDALPISNLQHYSGETGVSYLGQLTLMLFQFISAATGMAACAAVFNAMKERTTEKLGNFYTYFIKSCTRILLRSEEHTSELQSRSDLVCR